MTGWENNHTSHRKEAEGGVNEDTTLLGVGDCQTARTRPDGSGRNEACESGVNRCCNGFSGVESVCHPETAPLPLYAPSIHFPKNKAPSSLHTKPSNGASKMEKLIFTSVMYGVDKVPDSWFDKVPGGYFKQKEKEVEDKVNREKRHEKGKSGSRRSRRYSDDHGDRKARSRRSKSKSVHDRDGANDESEDERYRRRRSGGYRRRRRSFEDDRYGYDDGYGRHNGSTRRDEYDKRRRSQHAPPSGYTPPAAGPRTTQYVPPMQPTAPGSVPPGGFNAVPTPTASGPPAGYTPYSNIYGQPPPAPNSAFPPPPPPQTANGTARVPNGINTAVPPPPSAAPYMQNPYAQSPTYPPGAPPVAPSPTTQPVDPRIDSRYPRRSPTDISPSPPRRHRSRRQHPSDGYSDYESEISGDERYTRRKSEARSKSRIGKLTRYCHPCTYDPQLTIEKRTRDT